MSGVVNALAIVAIAGGGTFAVAVVAQTLAANWSRIRAALRGEPITPPQHPTRADHWRRVHIVGDRGPTICGARAVSPRRGLFARLVRR